jgi:hypothetical protein
MLATARVMTAMLMMTAAVQLPAQQMRMQVPCPVMLVSGDADRETIRVSFRNKGKMPIQEVSFGCSPPMKGQVRDSICHTERGLFYPGQMYTFGLGYVGAVGGPVVISVKTARLGDGNVWVSRPSGACRVLRVLRKK